MVRPVAREQPRYKLDYAGGSPKPAKENWIEQSASFIGFFIYLLILKTFFLPLFIIPTGSMAQTLYGEHALHTCPNCGTQFPVGWQPQLLDHLHRNGRWAHPGRYQPVVQCPNCRWQEYCGNPRMLHPARPQPDSMLRQPLRAVAGDRIFVHGWPFEPPLANWDAFGPQRWDVVVFKVPTDGQTNYIKRLIGLPGEKIELINGDVFVNDRIVPKTAEAQRSLWFPYFNTDFPPRQAAARAGYFPRWAAQDGGPWQGLGARVLRFDGLDAGPSELLFVTDPRDSNRPGLIQDIYSYNERNESTRPYEAVMDVRVSLELTVHQIGSAGYVEISISRGTERFSAQLQADSRVVLRYQPDPQQPAQEWGSALLRSMRRPIRLALAHVDGTVRLELNGQTMVETRPEQYTITPELARHLARTRPPIALRIGAGAVQATLRHVLIERDVHYTTDARLWEGERAPCFAADGNPLQLGPDDYLVLGDNSPNSLDGRYSFSPADLPRGEWLNRAVGPHLRAAYQRGEYRVGTVRRDHLIGRAFFVYWPGFLPLTPRGPNLLPDFGRARWIR